MPEKAILYSLDSHFADGWEDLVEVAGARSRHLARAHGALLVRPDAIASRQVGAMLDWLPAHGFSIVDSFVLEVDRHQVRSLWRYQWNVALRERRDACDALMTACPSLLLVLRDEQPDSPGATSRFRALKGSADPRQCRPGELRGLLGHRSRMLSLLHSPDEPADLVRELAVLLPERSRRAVFERMSRGATRSAQESAAVAEALCAKVERQELDLGPALDRVEAAAASRLIASSTSLARVQAMVAAMRRRERVDWRELFALLDAEGVPHRPWDRVTIAGHLASMDEAGKRVLVGHPPHGAAPPPRVASLVIDDAVGVPLPAGLTQLEAKAALHGTDTYFREGWEDAVAVAGDQAADLLFRHALMLVKPDAFVARRVDDILAWLQENDFPVVACQPVAVDDHQARALWAYQWNAAPRLRRDALVALLASGRSLLLLLRSDACPGFSAARRLAHLKGPADPSSRRPGDLRSRLASPAHLLSFVHAADEPADVARELAILLPERERRAVFAQMLQGAPVPDIETDRRVLSLCQQAPRHALDVQASARRLEDRLREGRDADTPQAEALLATLRRVRGGLPADCRPVFEWLDRRALACDDWDRLTVVAHASDVSHAGVEPLLPGAVPIEADAGGGRPGDGRADAPAGRHISPLRTVAQP